MSPSETENTGTAGPGNANTRILLLMSGSIACAKASSLISEWTRKGYGVKVACTRSVAAFVGPETLQGLGAAMVFDNVFEPGQAMAHISLGNWADVIVAAPATSNLINKLSAGIADDAVTTLWQAAYGHGKPMVIAPAMNTRMWRYPATQESVGRLKEWGVHVLPVAKGELACGETGEGRMLEPVEIVQAVDMLLNAGAKTAGKRILITAGGTREPIDTVRYIGNLSSGRTASNLADALSGAGHSVTWLGAKDAAQPNLPCAMARFSSYADLAAALQTQLGEADYDVVIHAAAVSDFSVAAVSSPDGAPLGEHTGKLSSGGELLLRLKPNPKLLDRIKGWSKNPDLRVIGFKLTDGADLQQRQAAVKKQFDDAGVDAVVHNDLAEISSGVHPFRFHAPSGPPVECNDTRALAKTINNFLETVA